MKQSPESETNNEVKNDRYVFLLLKERSEAQKEAKQLRSLLLDLLARIHRDGGETTSELGVEESSRRAHEIVVNLLASKDEIQSKAREL